MLYCRDNRVIKIWYNIVSLLVGQKVGKTLNVNKF